MSNLLDERDALTAERDALAAQVAASASAAKAVLATTIATELGRTFPTRVEFERCLQLLRSLAAADIPAAGRALLAERAEAVLREIMHKLEDRRFNWNDCLAESLEIARAYFAAAAPEEEKR